MTAADEELPPDAALERIAELAETLSRHPEVGEQVLELLDWVDAYHRDGLGQLVEMVRAWRGEIFLEAVANDPLAGGLLAAYDLGDAARASAEEAVERAMAEIRPLAASHGGNIEVVGIVDGVVEVRLAGTCDGCPSASATLQHGVAEALRRHWVNFRRLDVTEPAPPDASKLDLDCPVPVAGVRAAAPTAEPPLLQIRGRELS